MDVEELVRALQGLNISTRVLTVSDTRCVLSIDNGDTFSGFDGQISYTQKGSLAKLCAKFQVVSISDSQLALLQLVKTELFRVRASHKGSETSVKIISVVNPQSNLVEEVSELCAFSTRVLTELVQPATCNTLDFSEVLRLNTSEHSPRYVGTGDSARPSTAVVEGSQADYAAFQQENPPILQPYFDWQLQPGVPFPGVQWLYCPEDQGRPGSLDWAMSLFDAGIQFVSFPCKYLYFFSPANEFRLIPAPLHTSAFALTSGFQRDPYFCKTAKEMAIYATESQNPSLVPVADVQILSQIFPTDLLSIAMFEKSLSNCETIGKGGFGNILLNELRRKNGEKVPVAMKVIKAEKLGKASNIDALILEYKIMRACNHRSIVSVYGYTLFQDTLVIVMEYCAQKTLYKYVLEHKMTMQEKIKLLMQIADGIVFLNTKSICHLDLKPQNILIDAEGAAKLADFGLSKALKGKKLPGKTGYTLLYSAPEQIEGLEPGLEADIWAFGNLMYFVCFQKGPIDYVKNPTDNVHSFATKKLVLSEVKEKARKPLIPDTSEAFPIPHDFEVRHPKLVHLMRNCWVLDPNLRIKPIKLVKSLEKLLTSIHSN